MSSIINECYFPRKTYNPTKFSNVLNANNDYIFSIIKNYLYIYCLGSDPIFTICKKNNFEIRYIETHHKYKNIFLSTSKNEIQIWEINESEKNCKIKITVKAHKKPINKVLFCKNEEKKFISYSDDNTIKIWSMENSFCIANISVKAKINNIEFYKDYLFYQEDNEYIIVYDPIKFYKVSKMKINVEQFFVVYENDYNSVGESPYELIIFYDLKLYSKINSLTFNEEPENIFYENNLKILYIFHNFFFIVIKAKTMDIIFKIKITNYPVFYLGNQINNEFICGNFLSLENPLNIYSFAMKEIYDQKSIKDLTNLNPDFWNNCFNIISDMQILSWNNNEETQKNDFVFKNYLNDENIKDKLISNYKKSIKQKKADVSKEIKNFIINQNNLKESYIKLINMLIKDNTNKKLITIYLNFLYKYKTKIEYQYFVSYKEELNYYRIIFKDKELLIDNKTISKKVSEKDLFLDILMNIQELGKTKNFLQEDFFQSIDEKIKKFQVFNQPIEFDNKELYWYRNRYIIYYSLLKIKETKNEDKKKETFNLMQKSINNIIKRNLFKKEYILNNKILLTCIISLIVLPQKEEYCDFNLNLIESKDPEKKENSDLSLYIYNQNNKIFEKPLNENICSENFLLNNQKNMKLKDIELYNYEEMEKYFKNIIDIKKVNKLLSKIFCSKVIKEAFRILYPDNFEFPFNTEEEAFEFINDYFHYVPYKSLNTGGITEKFTLEVYYFLQVRKTIFDKRDLTQEEIDLIEKTYYNSNGVKTNIHEMNHNFHNLLFLQSNGFHSVTTPRKKNLDISESGKNLERLLFKRILYRMSLSECIYLLNEKNYDKSLEDFRDDFNEIKEIDIEIEKDGIFYEFTNIYKIKNYKSIIENSFMVSNNIQDNNNNILENSIIDNIEDENDVLGFINI